MSADAGDELPFDDDLTSALLDGPTLVLASRSPARLATLRSAGLDPLVVVSGVDEDDVVARYGVSEATHVALVLARAKAEAVADDVDAALDEGAQPDPNGDPDGDPAHVVAAQVPIDGALVLGCDSVLELDGDVYGKPASAEDARERWRRMRGRVGVLHTGHWLVDAREDGAGGTGGALGAVASTTVHFADLSDEEVDAYVDSGEPLHVAGAFTLDGLGGAYVSGIEGDHHNVVGVSLPLLRELLGQLGVPWHTLWRRGSS